MPEDLPPDDQLTAASAPERAYQHLRQQAAAPDLSPAQAQTLLAEALAQQEQLLLDNQRLRATVRQQQAAEQQRRQSEEKYRTLFASMDQGYCIIQMLHDAQGEPVDWRFLEVNAAFELQNGLSNATGKTIRELAPDIEAKWMRIYGQVAATGQSLRFEESSVALHRVFDLYAFRVGAPDAAQVAVLFTDITQQRRQQQQLAEFNQRLEQQVAARTQELRESRDQLRSVFDTSLIAMSVLEAVRDEAGHITDFRILAVNRELERQTGRQDLVGRLYAREYPGVVSAGIFAMLRRVVATGQPEDREYYYGHEGLNRWYASQFVKMGDGVVSTNLDVTERRQAEEELRQSLQLLEQAEAVAQSGSWVRELRPAALHWSAGMYRLFALPPGTPVEPTVYLTHAVPEHWPVAERIVRALTTEPADFEETLRLRLGQAERSLRIKAVVLRDAAGQPLRLLGVDLDISRVKRLEADNLQLRLRQQQAMFEAVLAAQEAERRRIAEALHNGLGQTLYAAKLQLDQLRNPATDTPGARAYALLADAIRQTRAISHELVPSVLVEFGLVAAVQDICHALRSPGLRFSCHLELDGVMLPQPLQVALYRMAQELAQNIVRHARATEASLTLETVPGFVLLRAEDNGVGFPPGGPTGAGVGLPGIRDRVALMGGAIDVGSAPQVGTYVRIRIPVGAAV